MNASKQANKIKNINTSSIKKKSIAVNVDNIDNNNNNNNSNSIKKKKQSDFHHKRPNKASLASAAAVTTTTTMNSITKDDNEGNINIKAKMKRTRSNVKENNNITPTTRKSIRLK